MIYNVDSSLLTDHLEPNSVHAVITDPPYGLHVMGNDWDKILPPQEVWDATFKVLRPGGFCAAFGHTRLFHQLGLQLEKAGYIIKDCLCWVYASGFPRSIDVGNKEGLEQWKGSGTVLKPAWEPIVLAQKPVEGTYADNIRKWQVGVLNIDDCRIPYESEKDKKSLESFVNFEGVDHGDSRYFSANKGGKKQVNVHPGGRFPANLLYLDPLWADYDRFFLVPKPSQNEKRSFNKHDTVKPIALMERLVRLLSPKPSVVSGVVVLDPFMGSGTTGVACMRLGRDFVGYELDSKSFSIANQRLKGKHQVDMFG